MKNGFIAITSVIIIGSLLALYIVIDSREVLDTEKNIERAQNTHQTFYNSESCANLALISTSTSRVLGMTMILPDGTCTL